MSAFLYHFTPRALRAMLSLLFSAAQRARGKARTMSYFSDARARSNLSLNLL